MKEGEIWSTTKKRLRKIKSFKSSSIGALDCSYEREKTVESPGIKDVTRERRKKTTRLHQFKRPLLGKKLNYHLYGG